MAGTSRTTIRDVAKAAGVSPTTVSHALNGRGQVDVRTRERVIEVARALEYRPNRHAQRLRTGGGHTIVLVSSMPFAIAAGASRLGFLMEIAAVAAAAALSRGLALVLAPPVDGDRVPLDVLEIDGALVVEPAAHDPQVDQLRRRGVPIVSIGRQPQGRPALPCVDLRSGETVTVLLEHLWATGARRIGLLVGDAQRTSHLQGQAAYRAFARAHDMDAIEATAEEARGEVAGYEAAMALSRAHHRLDGLCVPVDAFAVGALRALRELGRRVPDDIRVVTRYDGLRARTSNPQLTAMDLHLDVVGQAAIDLLFEHLSGQTKRRQVLAPLPTLLPRASSSLEPTPSAAERQR